MIIAQEIFIQMECYLRKQLPNEACGILLGKSYDNEIRLNEFIPVPNAAAEPLHHFELDPNTWIKHLLGTPDIIGLFHSHPTSYPVPSQADLDSLQHYGSLLKVFLIGSVYPDHKHMILNAYSIQKDEASTLITLAPADLRMT